MLVPKSHYVAIGKVVHPIIKQNKQHIAQQKAGAGNHNFNKAQAFEQHFARHDERTAQKTRQQAHPLFINKVIR